MICVDKHVVLDSAPSHMSRQPAIHSLPNSPHHKKTRRTDLARQHSVALSNLERLRRSKSCGEGRLSQPSFDFDIWSADSNSGNNVARDQLPSHKSSTMDDDKFKCGVCLFLPGLGFGKGKVVKPRNNDIAGMTPTTPPATLVSSSQRVSLERFECGSWRSSAVINCSEDEDGTNGSSLFFDLPVELIRCNSSRSVNEAESPVTAAFVFDHHIHVRPKGVLKNVMSSKILGRKSQDVNSPRRHVHFSGATADDGGRGGDADLNAFLEAQSV